VLEIGLVLGLEMVLRLAHFTFCHSRSPQKPASRRSAFYRCGMYDLTWYGSSHAKELLPF